MTIVRYVSSLLMSMLMTVSPVVAYAQINTTDKVAAFNRTSGTYAYENYATNQNFDKNLAGVTTLGGTPSNTTAVKLIGTASLQWSTASNTDIMTIRSKAIPIGLNGQNCQAKFIYSTPSGGPVSTQEFTIQAKNSAGTAISALTNLPATYDIANTQAGRTVIVFFPCPYNSVTPANSYVDLEVKHTAGNTTSIVFDELFVTYAVDVGQGVPNNVFSAKVTNAGVVSDENEDFINGNCSGSAPYTCTFVSGKFAVAPNCIVTQADASISSYISISTQATTTSIVLNSGSTGGQSRAFNISCTRAGSDFIQPTITPNQWNYEGSTTNTITGVSVNPTKGASITVDKFWYRRDGPYLIARIEYKQTSAGTTGTGDYLFGIPAITGCVIDTTRITPFTTGILTQTNSVGSFTGTDGTNVHNGQLYVYNSTSLRSFGSSSAGGGNFINSGYYDLAKANAGYTGTFSVPCVGWTENQNAPQLVGSVTSNSTGSIRTESVTFGGVTPYTNSPCTASTCTVWAATDLAISIPRTTTGTYSVQWTIPWSSKPTCIANPLDFAGNTSFPFMIDVTTINNSGFTKGSFRNTAAALADGAVVVTCFGPH